MNLRDAAAYHALVLGSEGASLATQRNYLFYWKRLIGYCDEAGCGDDLKLFSGDLLRAAAQWYRGQVSTSASRGGATGVRQFIQRMNTAGNFLVREMIIPETQFRAVKAPRVSKLLREPFSQVEVTAMWGAAPRTRSPERDEALFLLLLDTGMRIGEAATLTLAKMDLTMHRVIVGETNKGKRERLIPVGTGERRDGGRTVRALRKYLSVRPGNRFDHDRLFLTYDGKPIGAASLSDAVQHMGDLAGVKNPIPHRLRHTFCTDYLTMYPGDEIGLRRIVGHMSPQVLADYVHFSQTVIAERVGRVALSERWIGSGRPIAAARFERTVPVVQPRERPTGTDPDRSTPSRRSS